MQKEKNAGTGKKRPLPEQDDKEKNVSAIVVEPLPMAVLPGMGIGSTRCYLERLKLLCDPKIDPWKVALAGVEGGAKCKFTPQLEEQVAYAYRRAKPVAPECRQLFISRLAHGYALLTNAEVARKDWKECFPSSASAEYMAPLFKGEKSGILEFRSGSVGHTYNLAWLICKTGMHKLRHCWPDRSISGAAVERWAGDIEAFFKAYPQELEWWREEDTGDRYVPVINHEGMAVLWTSAKWLLSSREKDK